MVVRKGSPNSRNGCRASDDRYRAPSRSLIVEFADVSAVGRKGRRVKMGIFIVLVGWVVGFLISLGLVYRRLACRWSLAVGRWSLVVGTYVPLIWYREMRLRMSKLTY